MLRLTLIPLILFTLLGAPAACTKPSASGDGASSRQLDPLPRVAPPALTLALAARLAALPLSCIGRPYPNKPGHVLASDDEATPHAQRTPIFQGCFDWHSAVHMHWTLVRLIRRFPELPERARIVALLDAQFTPQKVAVELAFFQTPHNKTFERTYGWAWYLRLAGELALLEDPRAIAWRAALAPLTKHLRDASIAYLEKLPKPVRHGVHANTAFAMDMMLKYATAAGDAEFAAALKKRALSFFGGDRRCPAAYEPSGVDFISPCLAEAHLLAQVLPPTEFLPWFDAFLPTLSATEFDSLRAPPQVTDYQDYVIGHLVGLNFSRAWAFHGLAAAFPESDARRAGFLSLAAIHLNAGLAGMDRTGYGGEHWLASFATYALTAEN